MKYKVLMKDGIFIDEILLHKGCYQTNRPTLYLSDTNIKSFVESHNLTWAYCTGKGLPQKYLDNVLSCELVEFELVKSELAQALEDYSALLKKEIDDLVGIASAHHWQSGNVEEGIRLRELIQELKK